MTRLALLTIKGVFRDNVFRGILMTAFTFLVIPPISTLSMRQPTALALTLSLSLISFILLLLSIFLGGTSLWKDMERRYTIGVMGLPLSRSSYVLGKFAGVATFTFITAILLGAVSCLVVWYASGAYHLERPVIWLNVVLAILFDAQKYILLIACAFLFSTVSTSFFLPVFGAISVFLVGSAMQEVYEYLHSSAGQTFSPLFTKTITLLYYILPNFSAFDLKPHAIYSLSLSFSGLALTFGYFLVYTSIILTLSSMIFSKREIQ